MIYFVRSDRLVKIGYSVDPKRRMSNLGTASPYPLHLLGIMEGDKDLEMRLHMAFSRYRVNREWFLLTDDIADFIMDQCGGRVPTFYKKFRIDRPMFLAPIFASMLPAWSSLYDHVINGARPNEWMMMPLTYIGFVVVVLFLIQDRINARRLRKALAIK